MVDIEINAWSSLFLNIETNLILYLYPKKCIKFNQFRVSEAGKFEILRAILWLIYRNSLVLKKPIFDFSVLYPKKSGLSKKLKVSTLDIRIKQSGLKVNPILQLRRQNFCVVNLGIKYSSLAYADHGLIYFLFDIPCRP